MGFRFRKSINLGGFRINISKSGIGYSYGFKGARITKKAGGGTRTTFSIPGTGISYIKDSGGYSGVSKRKVGSVSSNERIPGPPTLEMLLSNLEMLQSNPVLDLECPYCGNAVARGQNFCTKCGRSLPSNVFFCSQCGEEIWSNQQTCPNCGAIILDDQTSEKGSDRQRLKWEDFCNYCHFGCLIFCVITILAVVALVLMLIFILFNAFFEALFG